MLLSYYGDVSLFEEIENFIIVDLGFDVVERAGFHLLKWNSHDYEFSNGEYKITIRFYNHASWDHEYDKDDHCVYLEFVKIRKPYDHGDLLLDLEFILTPKTLSILKSELIKLKSKFHLFELRLPE